MQITPAPNGFAVANRCLKALPSSLQLKIHTASKFMPPSRSKYRFVTKSLHFDSLEAEYTDLIALTYYIDEKPYNIISHYLKPSKDETFHIISGSLAWYFSGWLAPPSAGSRAESPLAKKASDKVEWPASTNPSPS